MRTRSMLCAMLIAALPLAGHAATVFHKAVPINASGTLSIASHNGSVTVSTWDQPAVSIDARIEPADFGGDDDDVSKTRVLVTGVPSAVHIDTDYNAVPSHSLWFGLGTVRSLPLVHYTIRMPADARLEVEVHNADVKTSGLTSPVRIRAHNGEVNVNNQSGATIVETHNGDVRVAFGRFAAPSRIETHNGSIDVGVPADTRLSIRSNSHHGRLSTDLPMIIHADGDDATGTLNGGGPELRFVSHNGTLHLSRK